jgi:hypothetical protein
MGRARRWWRWPLARHVGREPGTTGPTTAGHQQPMSRIPATHSWDFDVFEVPEEDLLGVVLSFFEDLGLIRDQNHQAAIMAFLTITQRHYSNENPYHNFQHCVDVTQATFVMLLCIRRAVSDVECYALLLAAVAHDLEHPGVNNAYLIKSENPLAIMYNNISVLENMHAARFLEIVSRCVFERFFPANRRKATH